MSYRDEPSVMFQLAPIRTGAHGGLGLDPLDTCIRSGLAGFLGDDLQAQISDLQAQLHALAAGIAAQTDDSARRAVQQQYNDVKAQLDRLYAQQRASEMPSGFFQSLASVEDAASSALSSLPTLAKWGAIGLVAVFGLQLVGAVRGRARG